MKVLEFSVSNYKSFRSETTLSFVATSQKDEPNYRIPNRYTTHGLLPVVGVYGANASGKSNLLSAFLQMRNHVLHSFKLDPDKDIPWTPWRLDVRDDTPPSGFALDFEWRGARYLYSFTHNRRVFLSETLWRWRTSRAELLFERDGTDWKFSRNLGGPKKQIADQTRANALFLSTAAQLNHALLKEVFAAFSAGIRRESHIELHGHPVFTADAPVVTETNRSLVESLLRALDVGSDGVALTEVKPDLDHLDEVMRPEVLDSLRAAMEGPLFALGLKRRSGDGSTWTLPPRHESRGTQIIFQRLNDLLAQQDAPGILVIDELETSLHPDICRLLLELYTSPTTNRDGCQLLFTTHERSLLEALRRDEVFIVDKDSVGESKLTAASDYKFLRKDNNLSAVHAQGRLGGVPVISDVSAVWGER